MLAGLWADTGDSECDEAIKSLALLTQADHHNHHIVEPADSFSALDVSELLETSVAAACEQEHSAPFDDDDDVPAVFIYTDPNAASVGLQRKKLRWGGKSSVADSDSVQQTDPATEQPQSPVMAPQGSVAPGKDEVLTDVSEGKTFREMLNAREKARLDALEAKRQAEESARNAARQAVVRAVAPILQQALNKRFRTHQEARAFYQQIRHMLRAAGAQVHGWRCNYANYVHFSPNDCACPGMGGEWIWKVA